MTQLDGLITTYIIIFSGGIVVRRVILPAFLGLNPHHLLLMYLFFLAFSSTIYYHTIAINVNPLSNFIRYFYQKRIS